MVAATAPLWFRSRPPDRPFPVAPRDNRVGQVGQAIPPASEAKPRAVLRRRQQVRTPGSKFEFARIEPVRIEPTRIDPPLKPDPLVVKLVTDDPEVVIVWLIDRNGDSL